LTPASNFVIIRNMMTKKEIDKGRAFDWGKVSEDYAKFRDIYPNLFYQKIIESGLCLKGQHVLDLGTGTGVLPRNLYKYGASFVGADISENQIKQAKRLSSEAGMNIEYIVSSAEDVKLPDESFDVIIAAQCFEYFDKKVALPNIHRMLKDDGHFCVLFMAWLPDENELACGSEELILKYNPNWTGYGMKRYKLETPKWSEELFEIEKAETFDLNVNFNRENWHGRIKACRGIGASSLTNSEIASFEEEHLEFLNKQPETFDILHFVSVLNLRKKRVINL